MLPSSPYGAAKLYSYHTVKIYRKAYKLFACNGILFNHESPIRGLEFVTRKVTKSVAEIFNGDRETLELGNLDAKRDWGFAKEYVEGMWRMLQQEEPDSFILATNRTHTVREFVVEAFNTLDIDIHFEGKGRNEIGIDKNTGKTLLRVNKEFYRPAEVDLLIGDYSKAKDKLGWQPKTSLSQLCNLMVKSDLAKLKK